MKTQKFLIALALTALVWIVFAQTAHFDWVRYDDRDYVYGSARVTSGLSFSNLAWAFTHFHAANWHPITTLSHMLDCQLFGVNPAWHHFSSVIIHALATIALFFALDSLTGKKLAKRICRRCLRHSPKAFRVYRSHWARWPVVRPPNYLATLPGGLMFKYIL